MCNNFRPAQPINDRTIFAFVPQQPGPGPAPVPTAAAPSATAAVAVLPTQAATTPAAVAADELGRAIPGPNAIPLAKLIGNPAKAAADTPSSPDTRHDLHGLNNDINKPASGTSSTDDKNKANVQELTGNSPVNSAFAKNSGSKESKLIPEGNAKQELSKEVEKTPNFAGKPASLGSNGQLNNKQNEKPTVAPGMRRQNL